MPLVNPRAVFDRADLFELNLCRQLNGLSRHRGVERLFVVASRLGNGVFWYSLMLALPLWYGVEALVVSMHMLLTGVVGLLIYRVLKEWLVRERPFVSWRFIACGTPALDRYSFPSGHTLHAVAFNTLLFAYFPQIAWCILPVTVLIALSRVVLGLHYPSDVLAGAMIGFGLAWAGMLIVGPVVIFQALAI